MCKSESFMPLLLALVVVFCLPGCKENKQASDVGTVKETDAFSFSEDSAYHAFFRYAPGKDVIISAHRGGPTAGFPENCLATFQATIDKGPFLIECDLRQTADGHYILINDRSLDSTTTGTGFVNETSLPEIKQLRLKDTNGTVTKYETPTLEEALDWAKGRAILLIDIRNEIDRKSLLSLLTSFKAQRNVIIIPNGIEVAEWYHRHDPSLILALNIRSQRDWREVNRFQIDQKRIIAFVGFQEPSSTLIDTLHSHGILTQVATLGSIDSTAVAKQPVYQRLRQDGIDIITTNYPELARAALAQQQD